MKETVLDKIVEYQLRTRQVGHTTAMLRGVHDNSHSYIVVGNLDQKNWMIQQLSDDTTIAKQRVVTVHQVRDGFLERMLQAGFAWPLVIDNVALLYIHEEEQNLREGK